MMDKSGVCALIALTILASIQSTTALKETVGFSLDRNTAPTPYAGDEGEILNIQVLRIPGDEGGPSQPIVINYGIVESRNDLVLMNQQDLTERSGQITLAAEDAFTNIPITLVDDNAPEEDEQYFIILKANDGDDIPIPDIVRVVAITVRANDLGTVGFVASSIVVDEPSDIADGALSIKINRTAFDSAGSDLSNAPTVEIDWSISNASTDITPTSGTVSLGGGATGTIDITILPDGVAENDEVFDVVLTSAGGVIVDPLRRSFQLQINANDDAVSVAQTAMSVAEDQGTISVEFTREGFVGDATTITYAISGTAKLGVDYTTSVSRTVVIDAGEASATVSFTLVDDTLQETDETIVITLISSTGDTRISASKTTTLTISYNDGAAGYFGFAEADIGTVEVTEGEETEGNTVTFEVRRDLDDPSTNIRGGTLIDASVEWELVSIANPVRIPANDFVSAKGTLDFTTGTASAVLSITTKQDVLPEVFHSYKIVLSNPTGDGKVIAAAASTNVNIPADDDPHGVVELLSLKMSTGVDITDKLFRFLQVNVQRSMGTIGDVTVQLSIGYSSDNGETTSDVVASATIEVTLDDGEATALTKNVAVSDAALLSSSGVFTVTITSVLAANSAGDNGVQGNAVIGNDKAQTIVPAANTIVGAVQFESPSRTVHEPEGGAKSFIISVIRTDGVYNDLAFDWTIAGQSASIDFAATSGSGIVAAGATRSSFNITVVADDHIELNETFALTLDGTSGTIGAQSRNDVIVSFNDQPPGYFGFGSETKPAYVMNEGGSVTFYVVRNLTDAFEPAKAYILVQEATMGWRLTSTGTGTVENEFAVVSGTVDFAVNQVWTSFTVTVSEDTTPEVLQTYTLELEDVSGNGVIVPDQSSVDVHIAANNVPHGEISLSGVEMEFGQDFTGADFRYIRVRATRMGGTLGAVTVNLKTVYTSDNGESTSDVVSTDTLAILFQAGDFSSRGDKAIRSKAALSTQGNFVFTIVSVTVQNAIGDDGVQADADVDVDTLEGAPGPKISVGVATFILPDLMPVTEPANGIGTYTVGIQRSNGVFGDLPYEYVIEGTGAAEDFKTLSGSGVFDASVNKAPINILVLSDTVPEIDEAFTLRLSSAFTEASRTSVTKSIVIVQNDNPYGLVEFDGASFSVEEDSTVAVQVKRSLGLFGSSTWGWMIMDHNDQFTTYNGTFEIADGASAASFDVTTNDDDVPELDATFTMKLSLISGQAEPGDNITAEIVITANDQPQGFFEFADPGGVVSAVESPFEETPVALSVVRTGGDLVAVTLKYRVDRIGASESASNDVNPSAGSIEFGVGVRNLDIIVGVKQDFVLEGAELFTVTLLDAVDGDSILPSDADVTRQSFVIVANDDPITFRETDITAEEASGSVAFTVVRGGSAKGPAEAAWEISAVQVPVGVTAPVNTPLSGLVFFADGVRERNFTISLNIDDTSQPDRYFQVKLSNTERIGSADVPAIGGRAIVTVPANPGCPLGETDCPIPAGGRFKFDIGSVPSYLSEDHGEFHLTVLREGGLFGNVLVRWREEQCSGEFNQTEGVIDFAGAQSSGKIPLRVLGDTLPELQKDCVFELYTLQVLSDGTGNASLHKSLNKADVAIAPNDGVFGRFSMDEPSTPLPVSEGSTFSVDVNRATSAEGTVRLEWMVVAPDATPLPVDSNQLLLGIPILGNTCTDDAGWKSKVNTGNGVESDRWDCAKYTEYFEDHPEENSTEHCNDPRETGITTACCACGGGSPSVVPSDRKESTLPVYKFSSDGNNALVLPSATYYGQSNNGTTIDRINDDISIVVRFKQEQGNTGYLWGSFEGDATAPTTLFALRSSSLNAGSRLHFEYLSSVGPQSLVFPYPGVVDSSQWHQVALVRKTEQSVGRVIFEAYFDGQLLAENVYNLSFPTGSVVKWTSARKEINAFLGKDLGNTQPFEGWLQEVRVFDSALTAVEVLETYSPAAAADIEPSSGMITFVPGQLSGEITSVSLEDTIPEDVGNFDFVLRHSGDGGVIASSQTNSKTVAVGPNDNAFGRFAFRNQRYTTKEGEQVRILVDRLDGAFGEVKVYWHLSNCVECDIVSPIKGCSACPGKISDDVNVSSGKVEFAVGQRLGEIGLDILDDQTNEFLENMSLTIWRVDGSGVIDEEKGDTTLEIRQSGFPYGQFFIVQDSTTKAVTVQENVGTLTFTINRSGPRVRGHMVVDVVVESGSATMWEDFHNVSNVQDIGGGKASFQVEFADEQTSATFEISIYDDEIPELDEWFVVALVEDLKQTAYADIIDDLRAVNVTIEKNDNPYGNITFGSASALTTNEVVRAGPSKTLAANEGEIVRLQVLREMGTFGAVSVDWIIDDADGQVFPLAGTVSFADGEAFKIIELSMINDGIPEVAFTFNVKIKCPDTITSCGGAVITNNNDNNNPDDATFAITLNGNDDVHGLFGLSLLDDSVKEPNVTRPVAIIISRTGGTVGDVRVYWKTSDMSAEAGKDYEAVEDGLVTFIDGVNTPKTVYVNVFADAVPEVLEQFAVVITSVETTTNQDEEDSPRVDDVKGQVVVDINANDYPGGVFWISSVTPKTTTEGSKLQFKVNRAAGIFGAAEIQWTVHDVTTTSEDYSVASGTVNFTEGDASLTFEIDVTDDVTPELVESFTVGIEIAHSDDASALGTAVIVGEDNTEVVVGGEIEVTITISKNDDANGVMAFAEASLQQDVSESEAGSTESIQLTIQRLGGSFGTVTVRCAVDAASQSEISPSEQLVEFLEDETSKTISFDISADTLPEADERHIISLIGSDGGSTVIAGERSTATVVITENDNAYGTFSFGDAAISATEPNEVDDFGEAEGEEDGITTTTLRIPVTRTGGRFGKVTMEYRTSAIAQAQMYNDAVPWSQLPLLFYLFETPVSGRLTTQTALNYKSISTAQGCLEACLDYSNGLCKSINLNPSIPRCELLAQVESAGGANLLPIPGYVHYEMASDKDTVLDYRRASNPEDYNAGIGVVSFAEGQRIAFVEIELEPDNIPELVESFNVELFNLESASRLTDSPRFGTSTVRVDIAANDYPYGVVTFSNKSTDTINETNGAKLTLYVERTYGAFGSIEVQWTSPLPLGRDLAGPRGGTVSFEDGVRVGQIRLPVIQDTTPEVDEEIDFFLSVPEDSLATVGALGANHTVTIPANDLANGLFSFSTQSRSIIENEPDGSAREFRLVVTRNAGVFGSALLRYVVYAESEGSNVTKDLGSSTGEVSFAQGVKNSIIKIPIKDDVETEGHEEFTVVLSVISSTIEGQADIDARYRTSTITIRANDEPHGVFSFAPDSGAVSVGEDVGSVALTVRRTFGDLGVIEVEYQIISVSADSDDYSSSTTTVRFDEGQTTGIITINILDEKVPEEDEVFQVRLVSATVIEGNTLLPGSPRLDTLSDAFLVSTVTIERNDNPNGVFTMGNDVSVPEDAESVIVDVIRGAGTIGASTVTLVLTYCPDTELCPTVETGLGWVDANDIVGGNTIRRTVRFTEYQSRSNITISIEDDDVPEIAEYFYVVIESVSKGDIGDRASARVVVEENDDAHGVIGFETPSEPLQIAEGGFISFTVLRQAGLFGRVTVDYAIRILGSGDVSDVTPNVGTAILNAGDDQVTITIRAVDDRIPEFDERFLLWLTSISGARFSESLPLALPFVLLENDYPFGLPSLPTNPAFVDVAEDEGFVHVTMTREFGTLGRLAAKWTATGNTPGAEITKPTGLSDALVRSIPVQRSETLSGQRWTTVTTLDNEQTMLGLSEAGDSTLYSTFKGDIYADATVAISGLAATAFKITYSCRGEVCEDVYFAVAGAKGGRVYLLRDGKLITRTSVVGVFLNVVHLFDGDEVFVVFVAAVKSIPSVVIRAASDVGNTVFKTSFKTVEFSGAATMTPFMSADGKKFLIGTTTNTSVLYQLQNNGLRKVFSLESSQGTKWAPIHRPKETYLVSVSKPGEITVQRFTGTQLGQPTTVKTTTSVRSIMALPSSHDWGAYFIGYEGDSDEGLAVFALDDSGSTPTVTDVGASFGNTVGKQVQAYVAMDDTTRVVACNIPGECSAFRLDVVGIGSDFTAPISGWATFPAGVDSTELAVGIVNDATPEVAESFKISLVDFDPKGNDTEGSSDDIKDFTVVIASNDDAFGVIGFAAESLSTFVEEPSQGVSQDVVLLLERTGGAFGPGRVQWSVNTSDVDVASASGIVTFLDGQRAANFTLTILNDAVIETTELFEITLDRAILGPSINDERSSARVTVGANDGVHGIFDLAAEAVITVGEGVGSIDFDVVRTAGVVGVVNVSYAVGVGSRSPQATAGEDYTAKTGFLVFQDGDSFGSFSVDLISDTIAEEAEWFVVKLTEVKQLEVSEQPLADALSLGAASEVEVKLKANDDASGVFSLANTTTVVAEEGSAVKFTIDRTGGTFGACSLSWSIEFDTALANDLQTGPTGGVLVFAPGEPTKDIIIRIEDDIEPEAEEEFKFTLDTVTGGIAESPPRIDNGQSEVTVLIPENDDARGVITLTKYDSVQTVKEDSVQKSDGSYVGDTITFGVTRSGGTLGVVVVYLSATGKIDDEVDIKFSRQTVEFSDGVSGTRNVTISIENDNQPEDNEVFDVVIAKVDGKATYNADDVLQYNIAASDGGFGTFGFSEDSVTVVLPEGEAGTTVVLTVDRLIAQFGAVNLDWSIGGVCVNPDDTNCIASNDFDASQQMKGTLEFAANEVSKEIRIQMRADNEPEGNEMFSVNLSLPESTNPAAVLNPTDAMATVTLLANDNGAGVFSWAAASLNLRVKEPSTTTLTVERKVASFGERSLKWTITDVNGTAVRTDFAVPSGVITFKDGETSKSIEIEAVDDSIPEMMETFNVQLELITNATTSEGARVSDVSSVVRILPNDDPFGVVAIREDLALTMLDDALSNVHALQFTLDRSGGTLADIQVQVSVKYTAALTTVATANARFVICQRGQCTVTIPEGVSSVGYSLDLPQGFFIGQGDQFTVTISSLSPVGDSPTIAVDGFDVAQLIVREDEADSVVSFAVAASTVVEGSSIPIEIIRTGTRGAVTVDWQVFGARTDVTPTEGAVVFQDGEKTKTVTITAIDDGIAEIDIVNRIDISDVNPNPGVDFLIAIQQHSLTVPANDDPFGVFRFTNGDLYTIEEGGDAAFVELKRAGGTNGAATVTFTLTTDAEATDYKVAGATAVDGEFNTFTVDFNDKQDFANLVLTAVDDLKPELAQSIVLKLTSVTGESGQPSLGGPRTDRVPATPSTEATVQIAKSDAPEGLFQFDRLQVDTTEGVGSIQLQVSRQDNTASAPRYNRVSGAVTVDWEAIPSNGVIGAGIAADFGNRKGTLKFPAGVGSVNISIPIVDDNVPELDEKFAIRLSNPTGGAELTTDKIQCLVTIKTNDDPNGKIGFNDKPISIEEGPDLVRIPVTRTGGSFGVATVSWRVVEIKGSTFTIADIDVDSGIIQFQAGEMSTNVLLQIKEDDMPEIDEYFSIELYNPSTGATLSSRDSKTVTILSHGTPHGVLSFSCDSKYGGTNADGASAATVDLVIERNDGSSGPTSVRVRTTAFGTADTTNFTAIDEVVEFDAGETTQTIKVATKGLGVESSSKTVQVQLSEPTNGATVSATGNIATVTLYATTFTSKLINQVQSAACDSETAFTAASVDAGVLTQVEFDQIVLGIRDLISGAIDSAAGRSSIEELLKIVTDSSRVGPDVTNNRGVPELVLAYSIYKQSLSTNRRRQQRSLIRARRQECALSTVSTTKAVSLGTFVEVEVSRGHPILFSSLNLTHGANKPVVTLPNAVFLDDTTDCRSLGHATYYTTALFPQSSRYYDQSTVSTANTAIDGYQVLGKTVVSLGANNQTKWIGGSAADPLLIDFPLNGESDFGAVCVRWGSALSDSNGAWTSQGCELATSSATTDVLTCECSEISAQHFAVLIPAIDENFVAMSITSQVGNFVVLAACIAVLLIYRCFHKERKSMSTFTVQLVMQLLFVIASVQVLLLLSFNLSDNASATASQIIAIFTHVFFTEQSMLIVAICWFLYQHRVTKREDTRFWHYVGGSWAASLLVVIVYLASDFGVRDEMSQVYGWADAKSRDFSLIPQENEGGVVGAVGGPMMLALAAIVWVLMKHLCSVDVVWLDQDDLFEGRANGYEMKLLLALFTLVLAFNGALLLFVYVDDMFQYVVLIFALILSLFTLLFYGGLAPSSKNVKNVAITNVTMEMQDPAITRLNRQSQSQNSFVLQPFSPAPAFENPAFMNPVYDMGDQRRTQQTNNRMSRSTLTAGFQDGSNAMASSSSPRVQDPRGATDLVRAQSQLRDGKVLAQETAAEEREFDDLLYTLDQHTFEGGLDSVSIKSLKLDTTSPEYHKKRLSIADTHL